MMLNNTSFVATNLSAFATLPCIPEGAILAYNVYLAVSMALGFLGNLLVLVVYCQNGTTHTTDWFIIFISIFDFISSFLNVPVYLTFTTGLWSRFGNDVICKIHMTFSQSTVIASPVLVGGLALERYLKVCRPTTPALSKDGSRNTCISIAMITFLVSVPCVALYNDDNGTCDTVNDGTIILVNKIYYLAFVVVFNALFVIVIFCYTSIAITILRSKVNLEKYAFTTTHNTYGDSEKRRICCLHVLCCIHRGTTSRVPQEKTTEIVVLPESSTGNDNVHGRNKPSKPTKPPANHEKGIKIHDKHSRINKSLRTTRISFFICLIFLISWIPPWISFAINSLAATDMKIGAPFHIFQLFANMSFLINTFMNPIIYVLMDMTFRKNMRNLFASFRKQAYAICSHFQRL